jgi:hypothetical protein
VIIGNGRGIVTHALRNCDYANARLFEFDLEAMAALSEAPVKSFDTRAGPRCAPKSLPHELSQRSDSVGDPARLPEAALRKPGLTAPLATPHNE